MPRCAGVTAAASLLNYVSVFGPEHSGEHFVPHLTVGLAQKTYLDRVLSEPFSSFTFSPANAAVYRVGPFGTTAKKLEPKP
jgi:hypothetical protein